MPCCKGSGSGAELGENGMWLDLGELGRAKYLRIIWVRYQSGTKLRDFPHRHLEAEAKQSG